MIKDSYSSTEAKRLCINRTLPSVSLEEFKGGNSDEHTQRLLSTFVALASLAEESQRLIAITSGFVVDLAEGALLRDHHDLDLLVLESDFVWLRGSLTDRGFSVLPFKRKNPVTSFQATREDETIDVGAISVTIHQVLDSTDLDGTPFIWPIEPPQFLWQRTIGSTPIYFVNPSVIYLFKQQSGRQSKQDVQDLDILARYIAH